MQTLPVAYEVREDKSPCAMSRCECAGVSFQEIVRRMEAEGVPLDEVCSRTQCGRTCTACVPDLQRFVAARQR